ncbi:MAG: DsrE family protein [Lawsonibacter sp.]|nr:DsrE family protein [Lawsonibacter sp.]
MPIVQVVFHIDESVKWGLLLKNVSNLLHEVDLNASQIEVVANAEAVEFYTVKTSSEHTTLAANLAEAGVKFAACSNALRDRGISEQELDPFVLVVPAGVLELAQRQKEGYAYIKP